MAKVFSPEGVTVGVVLIALGTLWTLANVGQLDLLSTLRTWWPLTLVVWGLAELWVTLRRRVLRPSPAAGATTEPRWEALERKLDEVSQLTEEAAGRTEDSDSRPS